MVPIGRRLAVPAAASAILLAVLLIGTPREASASPPLNACAAMSQEHVVVAYRRGDLVMPLRCGSPTWGFRHIVGRGRWNDRFNAKIALTFARGQEFDNGARYALFGADCRERCRVIVDPWAFRGVEVRPQGIVTAHETNWPNFVSWSDGTAAVPQHRTDCLLYDRIGWRA